MSKNFTRLTVFLVGIPLMLLGIALFPGNIAAQTTITAPEFVSPENGEVLTSAEFDELDWTNATGGTSPYQYRYQIYSDADYDDLIFQSNWLTTSRASISGLPEGDYFFRVRARDSASTRVMSAWSNSASDEYMVTVDNNGDDDDDDDDDDDFPDDRQDCQQGGWMNYPYYGNQGNCVSSTNYFNRFNSGFNLGINQGFNNPFYAGFNAGFYPLTPYPLGIYGNFSGNYGGMMGGGGYGGWGM